MHPELSAKQLGLLKQVAPRVQRVAVVWNAGNAPKYANWQYLNSATRTLDIAVQSFPVYNPVDFDSAFAAIREQRPDGMSLAVIAGASNYVAPQATLDALVPAFNYFP